MTSIAIALFIIAAIIASARLLIAPDLAGRVVALDVTLISFMGAIATHAAHTNNNQYLILLVVLAIIGFTATVSAARFLESDRYANDDPATTQPGATS